MAPDAREGLDQEIRRAVEAEALAAPLPEDLAQRTLGRALQWQAPTARGSRVRAHLRRRPLLAYSGAVAAAMAAFLAIGVLSTTGPPPGGTSTVSSPSPDRPDPAEVPAPDLAPPGSEPPAPVAPLPAPSIALEARRSPGSGVSAGRSVTPPSPLPAPSPSGPKLARTADLDVQVDEGRFEERWGQAQAVAGRFDGFVITSSADEVADRLARGRLTLRVPADKLDAVLAELRSLGTPRRLSTSATDVSGQLVDYDARLRAAQVNEAQLLDLLKQARSVQDNLAIRPRLEEVRREIETLQARRASVQAQVDLATVSVDLYERGAAPSRGQSDGRLSQAWRRAGDAAFATLAGMVVAVGYAGPLVIVALGVWFAVGAVRRRRLL